MLFANWRRIENRIARLLRKRTREADPKGPVSPPLLVWERAEVV